MRITNSDLQKELHAYVAECKEFKHEFKLRGKSHEDAAKAMCEFANTNNQLTALLNKQIEKVALLEKKEAIQDISIENNIKMMSKFELFADKALVQMSGIETAILTMSTRRNTWDNIWKIGFQCLVACGIVITAFKCIYELLK